jgi:hypothetical protein
MDLIRLTTNDPGTIGGDPDIATWSIDSIIQKWTSLIWTERYTEAGDFTLKTSNIEETREALPLRSFVSLLDSTETMIVEKQEISYDAFGVPEMTVTGRSVESFFENRVLDGDYRSWDSTAGPAPIEYNSKGKLLSDGTAAEPEASWEMLRRYRDDQAAALIIWNTVVDNSQILTGVGGRNWDNSIKKLMGNSRDLLVNTIVSTTGSFSGSAQDQALSLGPLYQQLIDILTGGKLGIRTMRPVPGVGNVRVISFDNNAAEVRTIKANPQKLRFDIYQGNDKRDSVILSHANGDLLNPRYVFTDEGYANIAAVDSDSWGRIDVNRDGDNQSRLASGFDRRVVYEKFDTPKNGRKTAEYQRMINRRGRAILAQSKKPAVFDGQVDVETGSRYKFGPSGDYYLGDLVTVRGRYGVNQTMRISEYVRTHDDTGESAYPTLALP